jgi:hypothetical protein
MIKIADGLLANLVELTETCADRGPLLLTQPFFRYLEGLSPLALTRIFTHIFTRVHANTALLWRKMKTMPNSCTHKPKRFVCV